MSSYNSHKYTFTFYTEDGGKSSIELLQESDRQAINVGYTRLYLVQQAVGVMVSNWKNKVVAKIYKQGGVK